MEQLLITGFDPFGGQTINPSWEAVSRLPDRIGAFSLHKRRIPTAFVKAAQAVVQEAEVLHPNVILCVGQAGGRAAVTPERLGINLRAARIPDNNGWMPLQEPISPDGPGILYATVPVEEMAQAICREGLPGEVSCSAGTFVCNDVLYSLLHRFSGSGVRVGFIHVPFLPEQGTPSLSMDQTLTALTAAIGVL